MSIQNLKKIELEITSDCNAACPGCARTLNLDKLNIQNLNFEKIKQIFPNKESIDGKSFKFCGVLGDPAMHVECVDMVDYLTSYGGYCELSTNGGVQPVAWWERMGKISKERPGLVYIHFCVDGHEETNHIYRVKTKFSIVARNMQAYANYASEGSAAWIYIVFDHNEHEIEKAKIHANTLGFNFATRTGMRNSLKNWVATIAKKDKEKKKVVVEKKVITTTGKKEHSKKTQVAELDKFIMQYKLQKNKNKNFDDKKKEILKTVVCKYIHEGEIFIGADATLWPCCFLYDSAFKNQEGIIDRLNQFEPNWNSLNYHTVNEILQHPWYTKLLGASWDPDHELHFARCIRTCAKNKAYHNEIKLDG